jgi:hypothetical protein
MSNFSTFAYVIDRDGAEHEIDIRVHYDCDYEPAYTSGLPENCYPASGDMVLTEIEILNDLPQMITDTDVRAAAEDAEERLVQEAWDDYFAQGADDE